MKSVPEYRTEQTDTPSPLQWGGLTLQLEFTSGAPPLQGLLFQLLERKKRGLN